MPPLLLPLYLFLTPDGSILRTLPISLHDFPSFGAAGPLQPHNPRILDLPETHHFSLNSLTASSGERLR